MTENPNNISTIHALIPFWVRALCSSSLPSLCKVQFSNAIELVGNKNKLILQL